MWVPLALAIEFSHRIVTHALQSLRSIGNARVEYLDTSSWQSSPLPVSLRRWHILINPTPKTVPPTQNSSSARKSPAIPINPRVDAASKLTVQAASARARARLGRDHARRARRGAVAGMAPSPTQHPPPPRGRHAALVLLFAISLFQYVDRWSVAAVLNELQRPPAEDGSLDGGFGLSDTSAGLVSTVFVRWRG